MKIEELKRLVSLGKVAQPTAKVILAALDVIEAVKRDWERGNRTHIALEVFDAALAATPVPKWTCLYCWHAISKEAVALRCPECDREGCGECMPGGRGCICPECEEKR
jgi:hypothetical protein